MSNILQAMEVSLVNSKLSVKSELINMTQVWIKEKSGSPKGNEPMASRTPGWEVKGSIPVWDSD